MGHAARAIVIENNQILVMYRNKNGVEYYTLVGGQLSENESAEAALHREVQEETGLEVVGSRLVFLEDHPEPYNKQSIFLCDVGPHGEVAIQDTSEEGLMNRIDINIHKPMWVSLKNFSKLHFSTMNLQQAILKSVEKGFPEHPKVI